MLFIFICFLHSIVSFLLSRECLLKTGIYFYSMIFCWSRSPGECLKSREFPLRHVSPANLPWAGWSSILFISRCMVEPFVQESCNSYQHPTSPSFITSRVLSGILFFFFSVDSRRPITVVLKKSGLKSLQLTLSDSNEFSLREVECCCLFRSTSSFKLKHRVRVSEIWLASCLDDVCETTKPLDRSFVVGWPTTNFVATFK